MNSLERNIRRMLRGRSTHSGASANRAFAQRLQRAFGAHSPQAALDSAVRIVLDSCGSRHERLFTILLNGDLRTGMSARSYYRAKKELVEWIAEVVAARLSGETVPALSRQSEPVPIALPMVDRLTPESIGPERYRGTDRARALSAAALCAEMSGEQERADALIGAAGDFVRNQFGRFDVPAAFEVAQNEFFIARCRGDLSAMRDALRTMARFRGRLSSESTLKFSLDCSEVFLYEGRIRDANLELQAALAHSSRCESTLLRSIALVRKAQIALVLQQMQAAEEAGILAAQIAHAHADVRVYASEVLGRSSLQTGSPWSSQGLESCRSAFHSLNVRTILARHQLRKARVRDACETASAAYAGAMRLQYLHLAGRAASTLALCLGPREGRPWVARSLRSYLVAKKQNVYVGADLYETDSHARRMLRSFLQSDDAVNAIARAYRERFPDAPFTKADDSLLSRLTAFTLRGALDTPAEPADTFSSAARRSSGYGYAISEIEREVRRVGALIAALSALLPPEQRETFTAGCRRQTTHARRAIRRSFARRHWNAWSASE